MRQLIFILFFSFVSSFALSLDQVRADLAQSSFASDSIEMSIRTTVNTPAGAQVVSIYIVQKGLSKTYTELRMPIMNQRSIVNGSRMKVVDLNTNKVQILPYNGEALAAMAYTNFNPLKSGEWDEPKFVSDGVYSIRGEKGTLYYDSKKKRVEKLESGEGDSFALTTFEYDAENNLKKMTVAVAAEGVNTSVVTEILAMRSSAKFPDKLFEF